MDRTKAVACLIALALLAGCSGTKPIVVGSKNFTEQVLLGEIVAQHLEHRLRTPVERQLDLGGTLLAHRALLSGQIDVYPEYSGTALAAILKLPTGDASATLERVQQEYARRRLVWLPPLGFNNTFAMVVRGADARAAKLETLSDAARSQQPWQIGGGYEYVDRPDGFPALMHTYNLRLKGAVKTMDLGLLYQALEQKQVGMAAGNSTDGLLAVMDFKILKDDKGAFPPYQASFVTRDQSIQAHPGLREALTELSGKFSDEQMRKLNYEVDGRHRPVADVARDFLAQAGLAGPR